MVGMVRVVLEVAVMDRAARGQVSVPLDAIVVPFAVATPCLNSALVLTKASDPSATLHYSFRPINSVADAVSKATAQ